MCSFFSTDSDDTGKYCSPRRELAPFFYELSRPGPVAAFLQTNEDGRNFLVTLSNGDMGMIRNDLRIMKSLEEVSPVMHKVMKLTSVSL